MSSFNTHDQAKAFLRAIGASAGAVVGAAVGGVVGALTPGHSSLSGLAIGGGGGAFLGAVFFVDVLS